MSSEDDLQQKLLARITTRRASIRAYLKSIERRSSWLLNTSIVSTAVTSILTAGPALGGTRFTEGVSGMLNTVDSNIWQVLCLGAMLLSLAAAITTGMYRSNDTGGRLEKSREASIQLDRLQTLLELGQVTAGDAIKQYEVLITIIPFIQD
jgi:hypothetical protein